MAFEEQLQQLAAGVPPPPAGDAAAIIRRGTRRRRRRLAAGVGAVAAAIAVLATVLPPLPGSGPGSPQIFGRPDAPATPEPDGSETEEPTETDPGLREPVAPGVSSYSSEPFPHRLTATLVDEQRHEWCVVETRGADADDPDADDFRDLDVVDCAWTFRLDALPFEEPARAMGAVSNDDGALVVWGIASPLTTDRADVTVAFDGEPVQAHAASGGFVPFALWSAATRVAPETIEVRQGGETTSTLSWPFDPADPWGAAPLDVATADTPDPGAASDDAAG